MTDKEIVKALEICLKSTNGCSHSNYTCEDCYLNGQPMCSSVLLQDTLDLINRLQAKADKLEIKNSELEYDLSLIRQERKETIKAEAYKEFADRLKEEKFKINYCGSAYNVVDEDDIDNLLKELEGNNQ